MAQLNEEHENFSYLEIEMSYNYSIISANYSAGKQETHTQGAGLTTIIAIPNVRERGVAIRKFFTKSVNEHHDGSNKTVLTEGQATSFAPATARSPERREHGQASNAKKQRKRTRRHYESLVLFRLDNPTHKIWGGEHCSTDNSVAL